MTTCLPKVLITGGHGQLAQAILQHPSANEFTLCALSRQQLDITQISSIITAINQHKPDYIINTAAYTAVDKAEQEQFQADEINHLGTQNIAIACRKNVIPLLHISTDYVFDGNTKVAYTEEAPVNPINHYGLSKWNGEQAIREQWEQHIILRVSGTFSAYGHNYLKTMVKLAQEKPLLRIVRDQITCPTSASDIAGTLLQIIKQYSTAGTYHFCSREAISWYEFTNKIIHQAKKYIPLTVQEVQAIKSVDYNAPAKRPAYSVLNCQKIAKDYGISQPSIDTGIAAGVEILLKDFIV